VDIGKHLIRYSLPGGVLIGLAAVFDFVSRWAWREQPTAAFALITSDGLATALGVVILGFVIYQFYYSMHQPIVRFPLPRIIRFGKTFDRGGWILAGLSTDKRRNKEILNKIREVQGIKGSIGNAKDIKSDDSYSDRWYRNMHAVRSLLNATRNTGDDRIRDDYVALSDMYHILGACRIATLFAGVTALVHAGLYFRLVEDHPFRSAGALVGSLYIAILWLRVVQHNRTDTLHTMRRQVRRDLRMWLVRHPEYLMMHPDVDTQLLIAGSTGERGPSDREGVPVDSRAAST